MAQHSSIPSLIKTPFGFASTAAEMVEGINLTDKQAIVTGGASGIGLETARALAGAGASVTLAVRKTGEGEKVAAEIRSSTGNDEVAVASLELTDYASITAFVAAWDRLLDILVNNAGVMAIQQLTLTDRGHEMQFVTNHLGHFALALGLHDALAAAGNARIVSVSYPQEGRGRPRRRRRLCPRPRQRRAALGGLAGVDRPGRRAVSAVLARRPGRGMIWRAHLCAPTR